jgi:hypothetical protein
MRRKEQWVKSSHVTRATQYSDDSGMKQAIDGVEPRTLKYAFPPVVCKIILVLLLIVRTSLLD